jgi:hypothetical protein
MCINCYIGTDQEINLLEFDWSNPAFCIMKADKTDFDAETFTTSRIYYIGTSNGCGCNFGTKKIPDKIIREAKQCIKNNKEFSPDIKRFFEYEDSYDLLDITIEESAKYFDDTQKLYNLILKLCANNKIVEFYGCQADHEKNKCDEIVTMDLSKGDLKIAFEKFQKQNIKLIFNG